jgi:hypothetical protein
MHPACILYPLYSKDVPNHDWRFLIACSCEDKDGHNAQLHFVLKEFLPAVVKAFDVALKDEKKGGRDRKLPPGLFPWTAQAAGRRGLGLLRPRKIRETSTSVLNEYYACNIDPTTKDYNDRAFYCRVFIAYNRTKLLPFTMAARVLTSSITRDPQMG